LDACGASIHTSPEKVKKNQKKILKTLKKTLLLKKEGRFSTYLFACCYC